MLVGGDCGWCVGGVSDGRGPKDAMLGPSPAKKWGQRSTIMKVCERERERERKRECRSASLFSLCLDFCLAHSHPLSLLRGEPAVFRGAQRAKRIDEHSGV